MEKRTWDLCEVSCERLGQISKCYVGGGKGREGEGEGWAEKTSRTGVHRVAERGVSEGCKIECGISVRKFRRRMGGWRGRRRRGRRRRREEEEGEGEEEEEKEEEEEEEWLICYHGSGKSGEGNL